MIAMIFALRWSWLLGIALFLPATLPGGAGGLSQKEICYFEEQTFFLSGDSCDLQVSPLEFSPILRTLEVGTPLRILRSWQSQNGNDWLQVAISTNQTIDMSSSARRGWINV